jgi:hypothetical protein
VARNLIDAFDFLTYRIATHTMDRLLCLDDQAFQLSAVVTNLLISKCLQGASMKSMYGRFSKRCSV